MEQQAKRLKEARELAGFLSARSAALAHGWVRWVIENAGADAGIDIWQNTRGTEVNTLLWFREEYLVVLGQRQGYWLLRTAYCTEKSGRIAQLRKERDVFRRANP